MKYIPWLVIGLVSQATAACGGRDRSQGIVVSADTLSAEVKGAEKKQPDDQSITANFGFSLEFAGTLLIVGARGYDRRGYQVQAFDLEQGRRRKWAARAEGSLGCMAGSLQTVALLEEHALVIRTQSSGEVLAEVPLPGKPQTCLSSPSEGCFVGTFSRESEAARSFAFCDSWGWAPRELVVAHGYRVLGAKDGLLVGVKEGVATFFRPQIFGGEGETLERTLPVGVADNAVVGDDFVAIRVLEPRDRLARIVLFEEKRGDWQQSYSVSERGSFGFALAASTDTLLVGAPGHRSDGKLIGDLRTLRRVNDQWRSHRAPISLERVLALSDEPPWLGYDVAVGRINGVPSFAVGVPGWPARARYGVPSFHGLVCVAPLGPAQGVGFCIGSDGVEIEGIGQSEP